MRRFRPAFTYANVMATIAVFIALGGTGYAALRLPRNSVGSAQLRRHAVTSLKIAPGAVSASRVKANSLTGAQINEGALGEVPSAAIAERAGTATNAGFASNAQNAATVGGVSAAQLRLSCPAGTVKYIGECFETAERGADNWSNAAMRCTHAGGRLPLMTELVSIAEDTGMTFSADEWTGDLDGTDAAVKANGRGGFRSQAGTDQLAPYRCVVLAAN